MEYAVAVHTGLVWHVGYPRSLQKALENYETCVSPRKVVVHRDGPTAPWQGLPEADEDEPCS